MKTMKRNRLLAMLLSLVMCVCLFPMPAAADYLSGDWESISIGDVNCHAFVFDSRLTGVTAFDLYIDVGMKAGARCENWDVWARRSRSGSFEEIGSIYLPEGNGSASATIRLSEAMNIDAVAVTPTIFGSYSWSMSIGISNPSYSSNSSSSSSSVFQDFYLTGECTEEVSIDGYNVDAFVLDTRLTGVSSFDLYVDMKPKAGAKCENWNVWVRRSRSGSFEKIGSIYVAGGSGEASKTIRLSRAMNIDAIALTPQSSGRFSWTFFLGISNPDT